MKSNILSNGVLIPSMGFGTWKLEEGEEAYRSVLTALELGYRHIDTAQLYGNEASVGRAIADSGLERKDVFLTTKVWNDKHGYADTLLSVEESMRKLQVTYLDLLLIHWPNPVAVRETIGWKERNAQVWKALEDLYRQGKVKAIGLSNFMEHHLEALLETAEILPQVNQIMLTPGAPQTDLVAYCRQKEITVEAYSPLGTGRLFESEEAQKLAQEHGCSLAQLALSWSLSKGFIPLPRSTKPKNIKENLESDSICLTEAVIAQLDRLEGVQGQLDPDQATF